MSSVGAGSTHTAGCQQTILVGRTPRDITIGPPEARGLHHLVLSALHLFLDRGRENMFRAGPIARGQLFRGRKPLCPEVFQEPEEEDVGRAKPAEMCWTAYHAR